MTVYSSDLAWRIPWTEELGGLQSHGVTESQTRPSDYTIFQSSFMFTAKLRREQYIDFPYPSCPHMCTASVSASFSFYIKHKNPNYCSKIRTLDDVMLCDVSCGGCLPTNTIQTPVPTLEKWFQLYRLDNLCCIIHAEPCSLESPSTFHCNIAIGPPITV